MAFIGVIEYSLDILSVLGFYQRVYIMLDAKQISSLVESVSKVLPQGLGELPENAQKNLKASLTRVFEKMDLVSREEFDLQSAVLAKTREKLDALQKQVDALETSSDK